MFTPPPAAKALKMDCIVKGIVSKEKCSKRQCGFINNKELFLCDNAECFNAVHAYCSTQIQESQGAAEQSFIGCSVKCYKVILKSLTTKTLSKWTKMETEKLVTFWGENNGLYKGMTMPRFLKNAADHVGTITNTQVTQ